MNRNRHKIDAIMGKLIFFTFLCIILPGPGGALAQDKGRELFKEQKYQEAAEAFAQKDMENPKQIRWRYNRGVASAWAGDKEAAVAAFSSVSKRAPESDKEVLFNSAYNQGNLAFDNQDFESAVHHYKEALSYNSQDRDARENLQIALWQKKVAQESTCQKEGQEDGQPDSEGKDGQGKKDRQKEKGDKKDQDQDNKKDGQQEQQQANKGDEKSRESGQDRKQAEEKNLDGKLESAQQLKASQGKKDQQEKKEAMAAISRRKAEALLDNTEDNIWIQFQGRGKKPRAGSGKNW